jgi:hypothetical protein
MHLFKYLKLRDTTQIYEAAPRAVIITPPYNLELPQETELRVPGVPMIIQIKDDNLQAVFCTYPSKDRVRDHV